MVYTANWQAVGISGRTDNRFLEDALASEGSIEQAQNDILSTVAKRTPKEHEKERMQRQVGFVLGLSSLLVDTLVTAPLNIFRLQCQVNPYSSSPSSLQIVYSLGNIYMRNGNLTGTLLSRICVNMLNEGILMSSQAFLESKCNPSVRSNQDSPSPTPEIFKIVRSVCIKSFCFLITMPFNICSIVYHGRTLAPAARLSFASCFKHGFRVCLGMHSNPYLPSFLGGFLVEYLLKDWIMSYIERMVLQMHRREEIPEGDEKNESRSAIAAFYPELVASFASRSCAHVLLYPLTTINSRLAIQHSQLVIDDTHSGLGLVHLDGMNYSSFWSCLKTIWTTERIGGYFKGFDVLLLEILTQKLILLFTYHFYCKLKPSTSLSR